MIRWALRRAIRAGGSLGFYLPDSIDAYLRRLLEAKAIDTVFDVGAHRGEFGARLRTLGYRGRIISFEPVAATYQELTQRAARDPQWRTHQFALGVADQECDIHIPPADDLASLLKPSDYSLSYFGASAAVVRTERVQVRRLDGVFSEAVNGLRGGVLLKVDAQGTDLDVVEGAKAVLPRIVAVQLELNVIPLYAAQSTLSTAIQRLSELGYDLGAVFPVLRAADGLRLVDADCFFVQRPPA